MRYLAKPPSCDPARVTGMSERLIVSRSSQVMRAGTFALSMLTWCCASGTAAAAESCNVCREYHQACVKAHSQQACRSEYDVCMKHCRR